MQEEKNDVVKKHNLSVTGRRNMNITGVEDVLSFDEQAVVMQTAMGDLIVRGESLHINKIDLENGDISLQGNIDALFYQETSKGKNSLLSRIFK